MTSEDQNTGALQSDHVQETRLGNLHRDRDLRNRDTNANVPRVSGGDGDAVPTFHVEATTAGIDDEFEDTSKDGATVGLLETEESRNSASNSTTPDRQSQSQSQYHYSAHEEAENAAGSELVTVPIAKLQQLVEFGIQVLQESKLRSQQNYGINDTYDYDPEQHRSSSIPLHSNPNPAQHRQTILSSIWVRARSNPFPLQKIKFESSNERQIRTEYNGTHSENFELAWHAHFKHLFKSEGSIPVLPCTMTVRKAWLKHNLQSLDARFRFRGINRIFEVFIECVKILGTLVAWDSRSVEGCTVGDVLVGCYERGIFGFPEKGKFGEPEEIQMQIGAVIGTGRNRLKIEEILAIRFDELLTLMHFERDAYLKIDVELAEGDTLRLDDLNIKALMTIGDLKIAWTPMLSEHLHLIESRKLLWVCWLGIEMPGSPFGQFQSHCISTYSKINEQLTRSSLTHSAVVFGRSLSETYSMLLMPSAPSTMYEELLSDLNFSPTTSSVASLDVPVLRTYHKKSTNIIDKQLFSAIKHKCAYSPHLFGPFEERVRRLRAYMDSQQPRGLRQLWEDNRDSLNYYTFWAAITFGGLSIFLGFASLIVSVLQTWRGWD